MLLSIRSAIGTLVIGIASELERDFDQRMARAENKLEERLDKLADRLASELTWG